MAFYIDRNVAFRYNLFQLRNVVGVYLGFRQAFSEHIGNLARERHLHRLFGVDIDHTRLVHISRDHQYRVYVAVGFLITLFHVVDRHVGKCLIVKILGVGKLVGVFAALVNHCDDLCIACVKLHEKYRHGNQCNHDQRRQKSGEDK